MNFELSFRMKKRGGGVSRGELRGLPDGVPVAPNALFSYKHVIFLLHGYAVGEQEGRAKLDRFASMLGQRPGETMVSVLWPGDSWAGKISYPLEGNDADDTGNNFARWILEVANLPGGIEISMVAHSLGNRVAMEAVLRLARKGRKARYTCLLAAAIDDFSLADPGSYRASTLASEHVAVLSSCKDTVLKRAYPAGDLLQNFLGRGEKLGRALGYGGPTDFKEHVLPGNVFSCKIDPHFDALHGHYLPPEDPMEAPHANHEHTASFVRNFLDGVPEPTFP